MLLDILKGLFGGRLKLPRDRVTRLPRVVRKATEPQVTAIQAALDEIAALPGLADIALNKKAPKGFYAAAEKFHAAYDAYVEEVSRLMGLQSAARPGTPEGCNACFEQPVGVTGVEGLVIYRKARPWRDFPDVAKELARLGEAQFEAIKSRHTGKDPDQIAMTSPAVQEGRLALAQRGEPCPLLDKETRRCRVWEVRPNVCRMHFIKSGPASPDDNYFKGDLKRIDAANIRLPVRQQLALMQIEKRMMLQAVPFLNANLLQLAHFAEGQTIPEAGEAPVRLGADGQPPPKANRNVAHAKKFQKEKEKEKRRKK
jgi:Fe-S-cluster containining protein